MRYWATLARITWRARHAPKVIQMRSDKDNSNLGWIHCGAQAILSNRGFGSPRTFSKHLHAQVFGDSASAFDRPPRCQKLHASPTFLHGHFLETDVETPSRIPASSSIRRKSRVVHQLLYVPRCRRSAAVISPRNCTICRGLCLYARSYRSRAISCSLEYLREINRFIAGRVSSYKRSASYPTFRASGPDLSDRLYSNQMESAAIG
jgi:hypothetical protein